MYMDNATAPGRSRRNWAILLSLSGVLAWGASAEAKLIGGPDIIPAPSSVVDDASGGGATNTAQQAFDERQNVVLPVAVATDGGGLPAGAFVSSHMIFLNTPETGPGASDQGVVWTFDAPIIGVMSDAAGNREAASNAILGAPGTIYPGAFAARGMEANDGYIVSGNQITVNMQVTEPGDWIRVVTRSNLEVSLDIHPTSCPNPLATRSQGVVPVAILGTSDLNVYDLDPTSILLEGVAPLKAAYEDVATPFDGDLCGCTTQGSDGQMDLTLKFSAQDLVAALGDVTQNEEVTLTVIGMRSDGLPFHGSDCMVIRGRIFKDDSGVEDAQWSNLKKIYR